MQFQIFLKNNPALFVTFSQTCPADSGDNWTSDAWEQCLSNKKIMKAIGRLRATLKPFLSNACEQVAAYTGDRHFSTKVLVAMQCAAKVEPHTALAQNAWLIFPSDRENNSLDVCNKVRWPVSRHPTNQRSHCTFYGMFCGPNRKPSLGYKCFLQDVWRNH